jgi:hypothetical protein
MLSLIEKFLDLNRNSIPELVVQVLNPSEDFFTSYTAEPEGELRQSRDIQTRRQADQSS